MSCNRNLLESCIESACKSIAVLVLMTTICADSGHSELKYDLKVAEKNKKLITSAQNGNKESMSLIASNYYKGENGFEKRLDLAFQWYVKAANAGLVSAIHKVGDMYFYGNGVEKNYNQALDWYQKARNVNHIDSSSLVNLALIYEKKLGNITKDHQSIINIYKEAISQGSTEALHRLGDFYFYNEKIENNYAKAREAYAKGSKNGSSGSLLSLGIMYEQGLGDKKNLEKAAAYYDQAVKAGNISALNYLGDMYYHGYGVKSNYKEAFQLYSRGVSKQNDNSLNQMAYMFDNGHGVTKDIVMAEKCYEERKKLIKNKAALTQKFEYMYDIEYRKKMRIFRPKGLNKRKKEFDIKANNY